jgi:hypothetical protein
MQSCWIEANIMQFAMLAMHMSYTPTFHDRHCYSAFRLVTGLAGLVQKLGDLLFECHSGSRPRCPNMACDAGTIQRDGPLFSRSTALFQHRTYTTFLVYSYEA